MNLLAASHQGDEPGDAIVADVVLRRLVQPLETVGSQQVSHRSPPSGGTAVVVRRRLRFPARNG